MMLSKNHVGDMAVNAARAACLLGCAHDSERGTWASRVVRQCYAAILDTACRNRLAATRGSLGRTVPFFTCCGSEADAPRAGI